MKWEKVFDFNELLKERPYGIAKSEKEDMYLRFFDELTEYHRSRCMVYENILRILKFKRINVLSDIPFFPVRLYKRIDIKSISNDKIFKILTSSGTSGDGTSKIFLDRETAINQSKSLSRIVTSFIKKRLPMIIVDSPSVIKDRNLYSARGAAIVGFSTFGINPVYALTDEMDLNLKEIHKFLDENGDKEILIFGFTSILWNYFIKKFDRKIPNGVIIHGGGWKKMLHLSVDNKIFKKTAKENLSIDRVHNYYGMAEQTGSIFFECEFGHLHSSIFSDIIIRNVNDFSVCDHGENGVIQLLSVLPLSYPGHSILSEDIGTVHGEDDCECGRLGKYFSVHGRIQNAEVRGCSDVNS